jgi:hypothetical protein
MMGEGLSQPQATAGPRSVIVVWAGLLFALAAPAIAYALHQFGGLWFLVKYLVLGCAVVALDWAIKRWPAARGLFYVWIGVIALVMAIMFITGLRS